MCPIHQRYYSSSSSSSSPFILQVPKDSKIVQFQEGKKSLLKTLVSFEKQTGNSFLFKIIVYSCLPGFGHLIVFCIMHGTCHKFSSNSKFFHH